MTTQTLTSRKLQKLEQAARVPVLATLLLVIAVELTKCAHRYRTRTRLARLDNHMLRDIGVTPEQAQREAQKSFWQH